LPISFAFKSTLLFYGLSKIGKSAYVAKFESFWPANMNLTISLPTFYAYCGRPTCCRGIGSRARFRE